MLKMRLTVFVEGIFSQVTSIKASRVLPLSITGAETEFHDFH
jgi:hypothetical protein